MRCRRCEHSCLRTSRSILNSTSREYVTSAIRSLTTEGILGAFLTGLAVLLFLRDVRGALIVVATIPLALLAAVVGLWVTGQTINIMTLGGLTLAIGILVDESTVAIENMHTHLAREQNKALAILNAGAEVAIPQFLAMLCVAAVFTPALFMVGPGKALFVPLALAVAFAMAASYFLARTFVPVMATWWLRASPHETARQKRLSFDAGERAVRSRGEPSRWPALGGPWHLRRHCLGRCGCDRHENRH